VQPERYDADDADDPRDAASAEELAWQSIVANYGDRPELDHPESAALDTDEPVGPAAPSTPPPASSAPFGGRFGNLVGGPVAEPPSDPGADDEGEDEDAFVPPEPPPVPRTTPDRLLAWIGIFGSPVVLLLSLILSISLPTFVAYVLVLGFVGGFGYLVARMPRGPRDPWDDGAQI